VSRAWNTNVISDEVIFQGCHCMPPSNPTAVAVLRERSAPRSLVNPSHKRGHPFENAYGTSYALLSLSRAPKGFFEAF
jgi:hypothetical protein